MAQIVYYFAAGVALGAPDVPMSFSVPTGNFGNVFAGYVAQKMGLPIDKLVVGSNRNDILTRFFEGGVMKADGVVPTLSPSMDIQVSSNFERLMFWPGRRQPLSPKLMEDFRRNGAMVMPQGLEFHAPGVRGLSLRRQATLSPYARSAHRRNLDPHSVIGVPPP
jgi:threonine synthase